jgi:hypothetical protein
MTTGALAEIELTITTGKPQAVRPSYHWTNSWLEA